MATLNFSITIDDAQIPDLKDAFDLGGKTNTEARAYLNTFLRESIHLRIKEYLRQKQIASLVEPVVNIT